MQIANAQLDRSHSHPLAGEKEFGLGSFPVPLSIPDSHVTLRWVTSPSLRFIRKVGCRRLPWLPHGREGRARDQACGKHWKMTEAPTRDELLLGKLKDREKCLQVRIWKPKLSEESIFSISEWKKDPEIPHRTTLYSYGNFSFWSIRH